MKYLVWLVALLGVSALGFIVTVWLVSERSLQHYPEVSAFAGVVPTETARIDHGKHLVRTRGCFGCHGQSLEGRVFTAEDWDWVKRAVAPNLAAYARDHDVATLERAIRHGVGADGRAFWSMPSYNFTRLSDDDLLDIIAYLRAAPVEDGDLPKPALGWNARWLLAFGGETNLAQWALDVPPLSHQDHDDPAVRRGEYLAMTTCNECHGFDLRGGFPGPQSPPDLAIVNAYPEADFRRLMKEGVGMGGRDDLGLMTTVAKDRFSSFTDEEIDDLRAFFTVMAEEPVPEGVWWRE